MKNLSGLLIFVLIITAVVAGYSLYQWQQKSIAANPVNSVQPPELFDADLIGQAAVDFTLIDLQQQAYSLNNWQNQVRLINFWASWCAPCLQEIPDFIAVGKRFQEQGFEIIGIAMDEPENIAEFVAKLSIDYPILYADMTTVTQLLAAYGNQLGTLPYSVVIDRSGIIRHIHAHGILTASELEKLIQPLL